MDHPSSESFVKEQIYFYGVYIVLGVVPLFSNFAVLLAVTTTKKLQSNRWLLLTAALIISDSILSVGYIIKSVIAMEQLVHVNNKSMSITKYSSFDCVSWGTVLVAGSISDQLLTLSIAIDRAIAMSNALFYRRHSDKMIKIILLITFCATVSFVIGSFIGVSNEDTVFQCTFTTGQTNSFKSMYYASAHVTSLTLVSVYAYLLVLLKLRGRQLKTFSTEANSIKMIELSRQIEITKKISPIIIFYCLTSVPGFSGLDILPHFIVIIASENLRRSFLICQLFVSVNTSINSFIYVWNSTEIRSDVANQFRKTVFQRKTAVRVLSAKRASEAKL